jgi:ribosome biogenesis GTPase / thiamine phosphate phosphatase
VGCNGGCVNKLQDYDEDDFRSRPGKHKSRPRSKDRPKFENAIDGLVITVDRGRFTVNLSDLDDVNIYAIKSRELGRKGVVVGDLVEVVGVDVKNPENMARIVKVKERKNSLQKSADDSESVERSLVSNIDMVAIVVATSEPEPNPRLIDRTVIAARLANAQPIIIATKTDVESSEKLSQMYQALDIPVISMNKTTNLDELLDLLEGKTTVLIGPSGVGKSTLVNRLVPDAGRRTGEVNDVTGQGKHTSTSAYALKVNSKTWIIDTPGIRSFGLAHASVEEILEGFPDLIQATTQCQKGCTHQDTSCAIESVAFENPALLPRLDSFRRLLASLETSEG